MTVGFQGLGSLNVLGGALASTRIATVGDQPGSFGQVLVRDAGSTWTVPFFLIINNGHVTVRDGGMLSTGFGTFILQNGILDGNGTVDGDVINFGEISPGNSPGTLTINGNYSQIG